MTNKFFNVDFDDLKPGQAIEPARKSILILEVDNVKNTVSFSLVIKLGAVRKEYLTDTVYCLDKNKFEEMIRKFEVVDMEADPFNYNNALAEKIFAEIRTKNMGVLNSNNVKTESPF